MTKDVQLQRVEMSLRTLYIFNSSFGSKEGEEDKKILYYYPKDEIINTKIKDVGLTEAIISFTATFTEGACKTLNTQKTTQVFYQPESGYWMVLVVNVPKELRLKDGVEVADYRGGDVHSDIVRAVLEKCYNMFRLHAGTFQMNFGAAGQSMQPEEARKHLQQQLEQFFDQHISTLKLSDCDALDVTRSIQYLPLNKSLFLRAHNFVKMLCETFPTIEDTILMYNEQIVCSGNIDPVDLSSVHSYIVDAILAKDIQNDASSSGLLRSNSCASEVYRNGAFVTSYEWSDSAAQPPKVFLQKEEKLNEYYLVIYRVLNSTLCLIVKAQNGLPQSDFYTELSSYLSPLAGLTNEIRETLVKPAQNSKTLLTTESDVAAPKYLFVNEQSLKHLTNFNVERHSSAAVGNIPANVMHLIADLWSETNAKQASDDAAAATTTFEEVQVKTTNDFWIVKRCCNWRQYYVIIFNSKATLLDVTQEAKRIFEQELTDDVFFDK